MPSGNVNVLIALFLAAVIVTIAPSNTAPQPADSAGLPAANPRFPAVPGAGPGTAIVEISNPALGVSDRCVNCHRFEAWSDLPDPRKKSTWELEPDEAKPGGAGQPAAAWLVGGAHPGGWLNWHPAAEFGCTTCHGGDGKALDYIGAGHAGAGSAARRGRLMDNWREMQARCGACHPGDYVPGAEELWRGRILIRELNCEACHSVGPNLKGTHDGPSLARVGEKLTSALIAAWPSHGSQWQVQSRMPEFRLTDSQAWLLADYLTREQPALESGAAVQQTPSTSDLDNGLRQLKLGRCVNCHILPKPTVTDPEDPLWLVPHGRIGPDLTHLAARVSFDWLQRFIAEPQAWYPGTRMPRYEFTDADRMDLATWLLAASADQPAMPQATVLTAEPARHAGMSVPEKQEAGRQLFSSLGCAGCHDAGDEALEFRAIGPSLVNIGESPLEWRPAPAQNLPGLWEYFNRKLAEPDFIETESLMPRFDLTALERVQIATALLAERTPPAPEYVAPLTIDTGLSPAAPTKSADWFWPRMLDPLGSGPAGLTRFERDMHPDSCAVCHREQYLQWNESRHAESMSPGMTGQLIDWISGDPLPSGEISESMEHSLQSSPADYSSCMRCHARLSQQNHIRPLQDKATGQQRRAADGTRLWEQNPHFIEGMYTAAHGCANCHVRVHTRLSTDEPVAVYAWNVEELDAHPLERTELLRQSEFCRDCHQFETDSGVPAGAAPRENTYAEWREWFNSAVEPKSCQQCHMPDGDHRFRGIHDKEYVAENVEISAWHRQQGDEMVAGITITNSGGGHLLPTYITPKIFVRAFFSDASQEVIWDSHYREVIGRGAQPRTQADGRTLWIDEFDTRIAPGEMHEFSYTEQVPDNADVFNLIVFVAPDDFYHRAYGRWLTQAWRSQQALVELAAIHRATRPEVTGYYLLRERHPVSI